MTNMTSINEEVISRLRAMNEPGSQSDIVSQGVVKDVQVAAGTATVRLNPVSEDKYTNEALAAAVRRELGDVDGIDRVVVNGVAQGGGGETSSVALPILETQSAMNASMLKAGQAPDSGYFEGGPEQLTSPELEIPDEEYEAWPPVHQWEIDPADPALVSREARARIGDWEYEIWWQEHPADLVYASIQALKDDEVTTGPERKHPVGRNVVVNLVYDKRRTAIIAVYGTARDFRPFIEAFRIGYGLERQVKESIQ